MNLIDYLASNTAAFIAVVGVLGLLVGSFLNVVIYRLPVMLEKEWRQQCTELLAPGSAAQEPSDADRFDLISPGSRCQNCGHQLRAHENIPVVSYLIQKGKCRACQNPISPRYPIIETTSAVLSMAVAWHFGFGLPACAALLMTWSLITLSVIDFDHQLLPDNITLPLLWIGLFISLFHVYTDAHSSIIGAMAGYISLWTIYILFKWVTGKEGMGYGDFKLFAAFGAWMGWQALPVIILLSSFAGALIGIALIAARGRDKNIPMPFGPYLAIAGWVNLLWGQDITHTYISLVT